LPDWLHHARAEFEMKAPVVRVAGHQRAVIELGEHARQQERCCA